VERRPVAEQGRRKGPPAQGHPPEKVRRLSSGEQGRGRVRKATPPKRMATWKLPAFSTGGELMWLRATKNRHVLVTRITHQAAMRLGLPLSVAEAYLVQLRRGSGWRSTCCKPKGSRPWSV
jgi:hypothetical protein